MNISTSSAPYDDGSDPGKLKGTCQVNTGILVVIGLAIGGIALVWFFFMAPLEKQMHERRLEMIQRKIEKRQQALGKQSEVEENREQ